MLCAEIVAFVISVSLKSAFSISYEFAVIKIFVGFALLIEPSGSEDTNAFLAFLATPRITKEPLKFI